MPGLFRSFFTGPFIPARDAHDAAPRAQQRFPVGAAEFFQACIDGNRDFLFARHGRSSGGPGRAVAPEYIIDPAYAMLHMHDRTISSGRNIEMRLGLAVEYRVAPVHRRRQLARRVILIESSTHDEIIPDHGLAYVCGWCFGMSVVKRTDYPRAKVHTGLLSGG